MVSFRLSLRLLAMGGRGEGIPDFIIFNCFVMIQLVLLVIVLVLLRFVYRKKS